MRYVSNIRCKQLHSRFTQLGHDICSRVVHKAFHCFSDPFDFLSYQILSNRNYLVLPFRRFIWLAQSSDFEQWPVMTSLWQPRWWGMAIFCSNPFRGNWWLWRAEFVCSVLGFFKQCWGIPSMKQLFGLLMLWWVWVNGWWSVEQYPPLRFCMASLSITGDCPCPKCWHEIYAHQLWLHPGYHYQRSAAHGEPLVWCAGIMQGPNLCQGSA